MPARPHQPTASWWRTTTRARTGLDGLATVPAPTAVGLRDGDDVIRLAKCSPSFAEGPAYAGPEHIQPT